MNVGQAWELMQTAGADALEVARACEIVKAFADARQLESFVELTEQQPSFIDPSGHLCDPVPAEVACALTWSSWTATRRVELAAEIAESLPAVADALRAGTVDLSKADEIARGTACLTPDARAQLADIACGYAQTHTRAQLRAWLAREVARREPEAARKRRRKARKDRRVWVQPEPDGMACLGAYLTAEEAQACYNALLAGAANHEGGVDAARADLLVARVAGLSPADPVPVQVLITPGGPELAGYGPLSPDHAKALCQGVTPIRLERPTPGLRYAPGVKLTRFVRARDRRCRFPGCRRPAVHCDIDHIVPWPDGTTSAANTQCLCRYHHRLKTHAGWRVRGRGDGTLWWSSPRGHHYRSEPDDP